MSNIHTTSISLLRRRRRVRRVRGFLHGSGGESSGDLFRIRGGAGSVGGAAAGRLHRVGGERGVTRRHRQRRGATATSAGAATNQSDALTSATSHGGSTTTTASHAQLLRVLLLRHLAHDLLRLHVDQLLGVLLRRHSPLKRARGERLLRGSRVGRRFRSGEGSGEVLLGRATVQAEAGELLGHGLAAASAACSCSSCSSCSAIAGDLNGQTSSRRDTAGRLRGVSGGGRRRRLLGSFGSSSSSSG